MVIKHAIINDHFKAMGSDELSNFSLILTMEMNLYQLIFTRLPRVFVLSERAYVNYTIIRSLSTKCSSFATHFNHFQIMFNDHDVSENIVT